MEKREILLWEDGAAQDAAAPVSMTYYPVDTWHSLPAVVIFPGGGYRERATHEGEAVAGYFQRRGFHAFVVHYRVLPALYPAALTDAQRAMKMIYAHCEEWRVDPAMVFALGFSAGGHLAGCLAVMEDVCRTGDGLDGISPVPAGAVLCYPVISTDAQNESLSHRCVRALTEGTDTAAEHLSLEKRVTEHTPPCFLWATSDDDVVSVTHTLKMGEALRAHHVPFAMHIYPSGRHGLGLADSYPDIGQWKEDAIRWMQGFRK